MIMIEETPSIEMAPRDVMFLVTAGMTALGRFLETRAIMPTVEEARDVLRKVDEGSRFPKPLIWRLDPRVSGRPFVCIVKPCTIACIE